MVKSIEQYQAEIKSVAQNLNIIGDHVDILSSMLAYALYSSNVEKTRITRELSLIKSTSINSKIQRAMDRNYSVFRGECPIVTLRVIPQTNRSLKVGDLLFESSDFNFYVAKSVELHQTPTFNGQEVDVRVSKRKETRTYRPTVNDRFFEILDKKISSTLHVKKDGVEIPTKRDFREHLNDESSLYDLTITDFGVRLYRSTFNDDIFNAQNGIEVTYYEYFEDLNLLNERLKFLRLDDMKIESYSEPKQTKRETAKDIETNALHQYFTISMLRSNTDVMHLFHMITRDNIQDTSWEYSDVDRRINIYLVPKVGSLRSEIAGIQSEFLDRVQRSYYVVQDFQVQEATPAPFRANITVYTYLYSQSVNQSDISDIVKRYSKKLNNLVNTELLKSDIARVQNVNYTELELVYTGATIPGVINNGEVYNPKNPNHRKLKKPSIYFDLDINITIKASEDIYR